MKEDILEFIQNNNLKIIISFRLYPKSDAIFKSNRLVFFPLSMKGYLMFCWKHNLKNISFH